MINFVALPLVVTVVVAVVGGRLLDRVHPDTAARSSAVLLASVSIAAAPTLWLIGLSGLTHMGVHNPIVDWSHHLLSDYPLVGATIGAASLLAAVVGTVRFAQVLLQHHRVRCTDPCPLQFVETDEVYAYTLPGPAATIAISSGLRAALDDDEFVVVMAHEESHARHRHDRFKLLALLAVALVPPVRSVAGRLDYYLERWADEEALGRTGIDRGVAARTIAKVALSGSGSGPGPVAALGIAQRGVAARAAALLVPPAQPKAGTRLETALLLGVTVLLAGYQLHHSLMFAVGLMR